jgi:hypothetical protein
MKEENGGKIDPERQAAYEAAARLAKAAGLDALPLDVVAPLLPVQPEWREFMKPKRRRPKAVD